MNIIGLDVTALIAILGIYRIYLYFNSITIAEIYRTFETTVLENKTKSPMFSVYDSFTNPFS
jgi:hypothetical protein